MYGQSAGGSAYARKGVNTFGASMKNNFGASGHFTSLIKSPQQQYMLKGPNFGNTRNPQNTMPKTSQHPRGRTVGAAGPTYQMPTSQQPGSNQVASRSSRQNLQRSHVVSQPRNDGNFNQSFYASQESTSYALNKAATAHKQRSTKVPYD